MLPQLKRRMLGLPLKEASFSRRGFPGCHSPSRGHLESVIRTFIEGYNIALGEPDMMRVPQRLDAAFPPAFAGFAYEGAGLYFGLMDLLLPGSKRRLAAFTRNAAPQQDFIATVGAGFALARVPFGLRRLAAYQARLDPMTSWCLTDGYGFHQGYFRWTQFTDGQAPAPASLDLQGRRLFDAGVGRSLWWVYGADAVAIAAAISRFDAERRPEMWTGIGTALAYAGGGPLKNASRLADLAGEFRADLLSGIPFAAHMREKGGNHAAWTDGVCSELLGMTVTETSRLIAAELAAYLDSWRGSEKDKWSGCYLALRDRVKHQLAKKGKGALWQSKLTMTS